MLLTWQSDSITPHRFPKKGISVLYHRKVWFMNQQQTQINLKVEHIVGNHSTECLEFVYEVTFGPFWLVLTLVSFRRLRRTDQHAEWRTHQAWGVDGIDSIRTHVVQHMETANNIRDKALNQLKDTAHFKFREVVGAIASTQATL